MLLPDAHKFRSGLRTVIKEALDSRNPCDLNCQGEDPLLRLAALKDLALEAATLSGCAVINADTRKAPSHTCQEAREVIYFSLTPDNVIIKRHLGVGGTAVFIREEQVLAATGGRARSIAATNHLSSHVDEPVKLEDALSAAAGFLALGIKPGELWSCPGRD